MANSTITIAFTQDLPIGANLGIGITTTSSFSGSQLIEFIFNWVNIRSAPGQVTQGSATLIAGEKSAINFAQAFELDVNNYLVERTDNVVTIIAAPTNFGALSAYTAFSPFAYRYDFLTDSFVLVPNHPSVTININNGLPNSFAITSAVFSSASALPCENVKLAITTNELAVKILSPVVINGNVDNPFFITLLRNQGYQLVLENASGEQFSKFIGTPSILTSLNFTTLINNGPTGATLIVQQSPSIGLTLEYSLDNTTWQNSNSFSGIAVGNYTLYIRDQLGCGTTKNFTIDEFGIQSPYFYISKANSIRFANRITFGDSANYKNDENTLSCEVDVDLAYQEIQQFQSADLVTTQFKSNYATNVATIIKEDLSLVNIPIVKKTNNIGIKDKRDARKYDVGDGRTGIYFISGNTYDYNTNSISGTYSLNGLLPEWAKIGNYFQISGAWYLIEDIVFNEDKNADVIIFTNTYNGLETNVIAGSIYNRFNYEVYEFTVDMVNYIDQKIKIQLVNSNVNFPTITHLSEIIWCKIKHENVLEIRYRNTTNTDVFYSSGIEFIIRIPFIKISGKTEDQSEVHKTDTDAILLNAELYEIDDFKFDPVTKEIWRKLMIALSHEKVLINGVGYVKNGNFDTEGPLEESNLYVLTASMIKTGSVYNSQTSGGLEFDGTEVAVPGLISTENGFVSY